MNSVIKEVKNTGVEAWVHNFLNNEGDNVEFSKGLKLERRYFSDPVEFDLSNIERCCGPEPDMKYKIDSEYFEYCIGKMLDSLSDGWHVPPLIVNYEDGKFTLNDGNHRYEALTRFGYKKFWVIFWATSKNDFKKLSEIYLHN